MADWIRVAALEDIPSGQARVFKVDGRRIAVCRVENDFYAIDDVCTHDSGPLGQGALDEYEIECPRHGARFDVRSGKATVFPAVVPVKTYVVKVDGSDVLVSATQAKS